MSEGIASVRAVVSYDTAALRWIVSTDNPDYIGISGSADTLETAMSAFAAALTERWGGPFEIVVA